MKKKKGPSNPDIKGGKVWGENWSTMKTGAIDSFRTTKDMSRQGNLGCLVGTFYRVVPHILSQVPALVGPAYIFRVICWARGPHALIFTWTEIVGNVS